MNVFADQTAAAAPQVRGRTGARLWARKDSWWAVAVVLAAGVVAAAFVANAQSRWDNYRTNAFDLAFFDQIIWNTSRGGWFQTTFVGYNFAGQHLEPILLLFVPAYWLGAGPPMLLATQAIMAAGAAIPLYAASRRFGLPAALSTAVAASYLLNPYLHRALDFDFHPEVMVALPVFGAAWAMAAKRYRLAAVLALSTLLFKEDAAFVALALAAVLWFEGARREAMVTGVIAVAYAFIAVVIIMPIVRGGASSDLVERYGYLVDTTRQSQFLPRLLTHPWVIPGHLFAPAQLWTMALFLGASAPLAALRPRLLVFLLPGLAVALLASHPEQRALELHYSAEVIPLAVLLGVLGARPALRRFALPVVAGAVLLPVFIGFLALSPFSPQAERQHGPSSTHLAALREGLEMVPNDAMQEVSAQSSLLPRLSQRANAWEFPQAAARVEWVVVDRYTHRSTQAVSAGYDAALANVRATFEQVYDRDGVEVFRRIR
ncbi:MAG: DUF2079 domain-containing protein [Tepidiformaceae bacterium]